MKNLSFSALVTSFLMFGNSVLAQQPVDDYDFSFPKIKFSPLQTIPAGATFKLTEVKKTERLSEENLRALSPLIDIDLKYNRKSPDVNFFLNTSGITVTGQETISEGGKYFLRISYKIKNSIECIGKDGATFKTVAMEDGTNIKTIKAGSNFFRQLTSDNDKYPKPADIPNIDANPGYVPTFEESFGKIPPAGFATTAQVDEFVKKYNSYILAKAEALAVQREFENGVALLELLYGTKTFREDFVVGKVKLKNNPTAYQDFDRAAEILKSAYKIFSANVADTAAYYPLLRNAVSAYTAIEAANDDRIKPEVVQSVIHHNLALAHAWLLNIEEANEYATKLSGNKKAAPLPLERIFRTIEFMKRRAIAKKGYPANLLESIAKP